MCGYSWYIQYHCDKNFWEGLLQIGGFVKYHLWVETNDIFEPLILIKWTLSQLNEHQVPIAQISLKVNGNKKHDEKVLFTIKVKMHITFSLLMCPDKFCAGAADV